MDLSPFECFNYVKQEFLVCVTVHKAKNLCIFNTDTFVKVSIDRKHQTTSVYKNSENPYFNEYFVFELYCSLPELLQLTVLFEVKMRKTCCVHPNIGELFIDLATVYNQPGHQFYKKWGKLENPIGKPSKKPRGHLQIDLSIITKNEPPTPAISQSHDYDDIGGNLLLSEEGENKSSNVRYFFTFYNGTFVKKSDYLIQISFAGMTAKTKLIKQTQYPMWNEQIKFSWYYPSLAKNFIIQIFNHETFQWKCISDYEIHFDELSFPNALPSLGPTYIYLYDSLNSHNYIGKLLIEIKTEKIGKVFASATRDIGLFTVSSLNEHLFWDDANFLIEVLIWQGDFVHCNYCSNLKFNFKCGSWQSQTMEIVLHNYELSNYKYFQQERPYKSILLNSYFPDCREKLYPDMLLDKFLYKMKEELEKFKIFVLHNAENYRLHAKCLKTLISSYEQIVKDIKKKIEYKGRKTLNDWDLNYRKYLNEFSSILIHDFHEYQKNLEAKTKNFQDNIDPIYKNLLTKVTEIQKILSSRVQDNWPELLLNLSAFGEVVAYCRLNVKNFLYTKDLNFCGRLCGKRQNLVFRPISCEHSCNCCGCIYAKIDGWIWIGTAAEKTALNNTHNYWNQKEAQYYEPLNEIYFNCNLYIHQAKIRPGTDESGLCDPKVRATFLNYQQETSVIYETLSPIWNQVIIFKNFILPGPVDSYIENPPLVALEIFDIDTKASTDYLGCTLLRLAIRSLNTRTITPFRVIFQDQSLENMFPPKMEWIPVSNEGKIFAEILVSGELIELLPEESIDMKISSEIYEGIPKEIAPKMRRYKVEVLFIGIRNWQKNVVKGCFAKCLFGGLILTSGICEHIMNENINFTDSYVQGICTLPDQLEYWPPIIFTHTDFSKKSESTIGASLISSSYKYLTSETDICECVPSNYNTETKIHHFVDISDETVPLIGSRSKSMPIFRNIHKTIIGKFKNMIHIPFKIVQGYSKHENISMINLHESTEYTWWTKFYNSLNINNEGNDGSAELKHKLMIYGSELEKQPEFNYFQDWAEPIHMVRGARKRNKNNLIQDEPYCTLKCKITIKSCERDAINSRNFITTKQSQSLHDDIVQSNNASALNLMSLCLNTNKDKLNFMAQEVPVLVRVYIVRGINLRSHDVKSQADPFLKLQFGTKKINDRKNYIQNQSNPIFGKMFEFQGIIPREHILHISIYDRGFIDDLIGYTFIDLEDRFRSKHRASVGIANEYSTIGYNSWHEFSSPKEILYELCNRHGLRPPKIQNSKIEVGGVKFEDSTKIDKKEDFEERLCLTALKRLAEIPAFRYSLVPEHVETRSLFRDDRPGIEQGKLQMWVEIYEHDKIPYPIDITPVQAKNFELRIIVWNTSDVILQEANIFGTKMSDIYVKCWLHNPKQAQFTDVHYRSLNGKGNFNWRMIFTLKYNKDEEMMIITRKGTAFDEHDDEIQMPPILHVQIWDDDTVSADDFLGSLEINLSHFREPTKLAKSCDLSLNNQKIKNKFESKPIINLFQKKHIRGWFPTVGKLNDGSTGLTGKVELELEILPEEEATLNPVGLAREPPHPLPFPKRPATSFAWFSNPFKSLKYIIGPFFKKLCIYLIGIVLLAVLVFALIKLVPQLMIGGT